MVCLVTQSCLTLCDTVNCRCPRLLCPRGFSRQGYWSGLPYPPPGDLSNSGIDPRSRTQQTDSLLSEPPGKPCNGIRTRKILACYWGAYGNMFWELLCVFMCVCPCWRWFMKKIFHTICLLKTQNLLFLSFLLAKQTIFFSQTLCFVIQNQGRCHAVLTVFPWGLPLMPQCSLYISHLLRYHRQRI